MSVAIRLRAVTAKSILLEHLNGLTEIQQQVKSDPAGARKLIQAWRGRVMATFCEYFVDEVSKRFAQDEAKPLPQLSLENRLRLTLSRYRSFLRSLREALDQSPADNLRDPYAARTPVGPAGNSVFIVHGHDEVNTLKLQRLLKDEWNLNVVVMKDEPAQGQTLIEKLEKLAKDVGFAFVVCTPDDRIDEGRRNYQQPRPNVFFELGWFCGRLGRERVCILKQESTALHSDFGGVEWIPFRSSIEESSLKISRESKKAGVVA